MNRTYVSPQLPPPAQRTSAVIAALLLFYFAASVNTTGRLALAAVLCTAPFVFNRGKRAARMILLAAFAGGAVGAFVTGTEKAPPGGLAAQLGDMLMAVVPQALLVGVASAGVGGVLVAAAFDWTTSNRRTTPRVLQSGRVFLLLSILYLTVMSVSLDVFTDVRLIAARKSMTADLRNLNALQEIYFANSRTYARHTRELPEFKPSQYNQVVIDRVDSAGWSATARSEMTTTTCKGSAGSVWIGEAPGPFEPECTEDRRWFR